MLLQFDGCEVVLIDGCWYFVVCVCDVVCGEWKLLMMDKCDVQCWVCVFMLVKDNWF